ncbi:MAG: hypothetical protein A3F13_02835 [Gammaproteobacteria bacterium RIFCSPHIGHO2_12_FULL_40_19]|nr:MAG: hypothetical protein A3F13_02835 [Gammaproteobacteria bacterium RIFCSPHIGHO2_12_FULL_40_19]
MIKKRVSQQGVGLLEIMLSLSLMTAFFVMSVRVYQAYRGRVEAVLLKQSAELIQSAGSAYYLSKCSNVAVLQPGQWQNVSVLNEFLPAAQSLFSAWSQAYAPGVYYQIQYKQVPNTPNYVLCVQTQLTRDLASTYQAIGATTYAGGPQLGFCVPSSGSVVWQSTPAMPPQSGMDSQVVTKLKIFRQRNRLTSAALSCQ